MIPLKQLEADATSGPSILPPPSIPFQASLNELKSSDTTANGREEPQYTPRADREDMELDTKLHREPLPTNQQVFSNRAIDRFSLQIQFPSCFFS